MAAIFKLGKDTQISINGRVLIGSNISIDGDVNLWADGVKLDLNLAPPIDVAIIGDVEKIELGSGTVAVNGSVDTIQTKSGDVECQDISGNIVTMSGAVNAGAVTGSITTISGDITHQ